MLKDIDDGLARCRQIIMRCYWMQSDLAIIDKELVKMQRWFNAQGKKNT